MEGIYEKKDRKKQNNLHSSEEIGAAKSVETVQLNPLIPMSNRDRISPYNINTITSRQVMRIKKNVNLGIII